MNSLYLHIPFCSKICPFCSFTVRRDRPSLHKKYILGLIKEIERRAIWIQEGRQNKNLPRQKLLKSIYFGGGTPSRLRISDVEDLLSEIKYYFPFSNQTEISFEMNPEDVNSEYLSGLHDIGVNRVSLGGQSFQSNTLRELGRIHSVSRLRKALKSIVQSRINNWNLDLIFGVQKQSIKMFKRDVEEALSYNPPHISLYGLEIHKKTSFGKNSQIYKWCQDHKSQFEVMYLWGKERLEKDGLFQYEISNFAKKNKKGINNLMVWSGNEYLGLGIGAHSYLRRTRWGNNRSLKTYIKNIEENVWPVDFEEPIQMCEMATEFLMLNLRQNSGLNIDKWQKKFDIRWENHQYDFIKMLCDSGRAFWKDKKLCLTAKGMLVADKITVELMCQGHS